MTKHLAAVENSNHAWEVVLFCPLNVIMAVLRQQRAVLLLPRLHYLDLHLPGVRGQHQLLVMNMPALPAASNNSVNMT